RRPLHQVDGQNGFVPDRMIIQISDLFCGQYTHTSSETGEYEKKRLPIDLSHHDIDRADDSDEIGDKNSPGDLGQHRKVYKAARPAFTPKRNITSSVRPEEESKLTFWRLAPDVEILRGRPYLFRHQC